MKLEELPLYNKIKVGVKLRINEEPDYWASLSGENGLKKVSYPYEFVIKSHEEDGDYISIGDGKFGWSYTEDTYKCFEIVEEYKGKVIHCTTQEEWNFVLDKIDIDLMADDWSDYKIESCINISREMYGNKDFYFRENYQILSFQEWCDENGYDNTMNTKFEFNQWHKDPDSKWMCYIQSKTSGYGFNATGGWWINDGYRWGSVYSYPKATKEEVNARLIEFAKEKYPIGTKYYSAYNPGQSYFINNDWSLSDNGIQIRNNGYNVFYRGKWAEIIPEETAVLNTKSTPGLSVIQPVEYTAKKISIKLAKKEDFAEPIIISKNKNKRKLLTF